MVVILVMFLLSCSKIGVYKKGKEYIGEYVYKDKEGRLQIYLSLVSDSSFFFKKRNRNELAMLTGQIFNKQRKGNTFFFIYQ